MPRRIQMSRQRPWRADNPDAVIVARPSRWGNPFRVGRQSEENAAFGRLTAQQAVDLFALHIGPMGNYEYDTETLDRVRRELAGRDLACWCPLEDADGSRVPCHADVLLVLANPGLVIP